MHLVRRKKIIFYNVLPFCLLVAGGVTAVGITGFMEAGSTDQWSALAIGCISIIIGAFGVAVMLSHLIYRIELEEDKVVFKNLFGNIIRAAGNGYSVEEIEGVGKQLSVQFKERDCQQMLVSSSQWMGI